MTKISQMNPAEPLDGSELVETVQGGTSKQTTAAEVALLASKSIPFVNLAELVTSTRAKLNETQYFMRKSGVRVYTFPTSLTWRIVHNAKTVDFVESVKNLELERIYANVKIVDENEFLVEFTEPESGTVSVVFHVNV